MEVVKSLVVFALLGFASHASAQTVRGSESDSFRVQIGILSTCTAVAADDIVFGTGIVPSAITIPATGRVSVYCTVGQTYSIGLDNGQNYFESTRNMVNNVVRIPYTLSATAGGTNWGNADTDRESGVGTGMATAREHTVYAEATLSGDEPSGDYEDTVTATLYF